ncbi:lipid III flippase WzxE, partial [Escherichia coli]|nr:lipid III flippase WzxE [Escherichia coli]
MYVFGYLVIAKATLQFLSMAEISQFTVFMVLAHWLIPAHGALVAAQVN